MYTNISRDHFNSFSPSVHNSTMLMNKTFDVPETVFLNTSSPSSLFIFNASYYFHMIPKCDYSHLSPYISYGLFITGNIFLLACYLIPIRNMQYLHEMRQGIYIGYAFLTMSSYLVCALHLTAWNLVFSILNFLHYFGNLKGFDSTSFHSELEAVYRELFKPLKMSKRQFKQVLKVSRETRYLKPKEAYCVENVTKVDRLTLVVSGRLVVSQNGRVLHVVEAKQFLDSPEWFGVCSNDTYQVSITALDACEIVIWHRDKLKLSISNDPFLQAVLDNVLGKDVVKKLLLVSESTCNGVGLYVCDDVVAETTKLLSKSKKGETGLGVLMSRQVKSRETNVWTLAKKGKIETDAETSV